MKPLGMTWPGGISGRCNKICFMALATIRGSGPHPNSRSYSRMTTPKDHDLSFLSQRSHWEEKYRAEAVQDPRQNHSSFDWLLEFERLKNDLMHLLVPNSSDGPLFVLDLGCATSTLASKLVKASPHPLVAFCVDFSIGALLKQQQCALTNSSSIEYFASDATQLGLRDGVIDLVIDKGTTDSVLKDLETGKTQAGQILQESLRVLKPGGTLIQVTDEDPDLRLPLLEAISCSGERNYRTNTSFKTVETDGKLDSVEYFMYFIGKTSK